MKPNKILLLGFAALLSVGFSLGGSVSASRVSSVHGSQPAQHHHNGQYENEHHNEQRTLSIVFHISNRMDENGGGGVLYYPEDRFSIEDAVVSIVEHAQDTFHLIPIVVDRLRARLEHLFEQFYARHGADVTPNVEIELYRSELSNIDGLNYFDADISVYR